MQALTRMILGLGNPGERYRDTRHNVGFRVVDEVARRRQIELTGNECNAIVGEDDEVLLAKPQTYMNRSGYAARCLVERRKLDPRRVLVLYDEVHLPLGRLRLRRSGSPAGHRGMESVLENLRTEDVARLRIGVGVEGLASENLVDFVLAPFDPDEREVVDDTVDRAASACLAWVEEGVEAAMNRFNG